jgi:hypothetical protein
MSSSATVHEVGVVGFVVVQRAAPTRATPVTLDGPVVVADALVAAAQTVTLTGAGAR